MPRKRASSSHITMKKNTNFLIMQCFACSGDAIVVKIVDIRSCDVYDKRTSRLPFEQTGGLGPRTGQSLENKSKSNILISLNVPAGLWYLFWQVN